MSSLRMQVAEAVRDLLNDGDFTVPFSADVMIIPHYELAETVDLKVTVVPVASDRTRKARGHDQTNITINVGIQQQVEKQDTDRAMRLDELVEDITAYLLGSSVVIEDVSFGCYQTDNTLVDPSSIDEDNLFSGLVSATYRGIVPRRSA